MKRPMTVAGRTQNKTLTHFYHQWTCYYLVIWDWLFHLVLVMWLCNIVSIPEGRTTAESFDSKYIEVSAILNHKVDDLLVGTLKQIRLNPERKRRGRKPAKPGGLLNMGNKNKKSSNLLMTDLGAGCMTSTKDNALIRMLKIGAKRLSKSCENLLTL